MKRAGSLGVPVWSIWFEPRKSDPKSSIPPLVFADPVRDLIWDGESRKVGTVVGHFAVVDGRELKKLLNLPLLILDGPGGGDASI